MFIKLLALSIFASAMALANLNTTHWVKIHATDKYERTAISNTGVAIEQTGDDYVVVLANSSQKKILEKNFKVMSTYKVDFKAMNFDNMFDSKYSTYQDVLNKANALGANNTDILSIEDIGRSLEGRKIFNMRISADLANSHQKPAIFFMGTHHARERLSTEMPILLAEHLVTQYRAGNAKIVELLNTREIHIVPVVNPDGMVFDMSSSNFKMWRKNRRKNNDGTIGVDLNRNYSFQWGTGGSSNQGSSDVFMGPQAFSEPETQSIRNFIEAHENINILLSFHTFSELILYPWGHKYESIADARDFAVHKTMAEKMSKWNNYKPQQSSGLYIASGDTTDWSYGVHKIISFTFELDPKNQWSGAFYPNPNVISNVFQKNLPAALYLIEHADNPYRVLESKARASGLQSDLF